MEDSGLAGPEHDVVPARDAGTALALLLARRSRGLVLLVGLGLRARVPGFGLRARVPGLGARVPGLGARVPGLGLELTGGRLGPGPGLQDLGVLRGRVLGQLVGRGADRRLIVPGLLLHGLRAEEVLERGL